jgi:hypothetical protein
VRILAVDPGDHVSAFVYSDLAGVLRTDIISNHEVLPLVEELRQGGVCDFLAIEMIASYGMPVGQTVFETCLWIGRFIQAWGGPYKLIYRKQVMLHHCHSTRGKDANLRAALLDRYGGKVAIGTKKKPGPLYGFSKDKWAALGVYHYAYDLYREQGQDWLLEK